MSLWFILPVKPLSEGKSRLSSILTPIKRQELNTYLFMRTLKLLTSILPQRVLVISRCKRVLTLARQHHAPSLLESSAGGLNEALSQAQAWLKTRATNIVIIPCDLPYVTQFDLEQLLSLNSGGVIIARDRLQQGTNALIHPNPIAMDYQFNGKNSAQCHADTANRAGFKTKYYDNPRFAFDIDLPEHYLDWYTSCPMQDNFQLKKLFHPF